MTVNAVFAKTEKGRQEMIARTDKLNPRQRRVLIFIDGKTTVEQLRTKVTADDLSHTLGLLEEDGFIELVGVADESGNVNSADIPLPGLSEFRPIPDPPNPKELEMAKNFMLNTLKTFVGPYGHVGLMTSIFESGSHEVLRIHFDAWFHAIMQTRDGKRRAEELRGQLLKVI